MGFFWGLIFGQGIFLGFVGNPRDLFGLRLFFPSRLSCNLISGVPPPPPPPPLDAGERILGRIDFKLVYYIFSFVPDNPKIKKLQI